MHDAYKKPRRWLTRHPPNDYISLILFYLGAFGAVVLTALAAWLIGAVVLAITPGLKCDHSNTPPMELSK